MLVQALGTIFLKIRAFLPIEPRKLLGLCFGERGFLYDFAVALEERRTFLVIAEQTKSSNLLHHDNKR